MKYKATMYRKIHIEAEFDDGEGIADEDFDPRYYAIAYINEMYPMDTWNTDDEFLYIEEVNDEI